MQPEHLLEQSDLLLSLSRNGQPRQADKRRAVSTAYYAVFHQVLRAAADTFVGHGAPWPVYTAVYRSIDHRKLKATCEGALGRAWPQQPTDPSMVAFCTRPIALAELRNLADYDPSFRINLGPARDAVAAAREAITSFGRIAPDQKRLFLTFLAFQRRS